MNMEDKLEQFFGWASSDPDPDISLWEQLTGAEPTRRWWKIVFGVSTGLVVEELEGESYSAVFHHPIGARVEPTEGIIVHIDWYALYGREGAHSVYERCAEALSLVGRA